MGKKLLKITMFGLVTLFLFVQIGWFMLPMLAPVLSGASDWVPIPLENVKTSCYQESEPLSWTWCVHKMEHQSQDTILYHLHGRRGAANWWNDKEYFSGDVMNLWDRQDLVPPTVVGISFGPLWLLQDEESMSGEAPPIGLLTEQLIPKIEIQLGLKIKKRMVVGESMGGVNALMLLAHASGSFARVAALCPPLSQLPPDAALTDIFKKVTDSSLSLKRALLLSAMGRYFYPESDRWYKLDPVQKLAVTQQVNTKSVYISAGQRDDWDCQGGIPALTRELERLNVDVTLDTRDAGHCWVDPKKLATFLVGEKVEHTLL